ncbi:BTB/POZ domain-containing protein At3g50780 [Corylus avellana]|uniref:BTB/POZ domain-containing protein At3g50780 n=1 Tax=Corylus avellana TaxID=13451 RepID=UPI001E21CF90|nr:BTB/POZ domain-containing protein At3g50780 [Corylus avellana]XP_059456328.1 BTB/POZ domain-containing protein At3g50780 [Corylus avellana]XP_059456329.1 BTB/POZ domain-containing protein At3g50780 [Corylus avellana]
MAEIRLTRVEQGQTKIRNVPIAVTPEGFWCCPSPVVFQKTLKAQNPLNKPKPSSSPPKINVQKKQTPVTERKPTLTPSRPGIISDDQRTFGSDTPGFSVPVAAERAPRPKIENLPRKVAIEFGEPGTSDMKVILLGKQGFCVKLSVHKNILVENSRYIADKLSEQSGLSFLEIDDCEDVEIYVETVGLMYCKEIKQRLIKQSVSRVLRILKVAELLGFNSCMQSCLEYLEAVPWVGEEEEKVVSSVLRLQGEGVGVTPVLKRVSSDISRSPKDTLSQIIDLVLKSNEERGRREMKSIVLKLLRENNSLPSYAGSADICNETLYSSCKSCLNSLLSWFRQAAEPGFADKPMDRKEPVVKQIALEADNLSWLVEILADRQAADEVALLWAGQQELATLHSKLPIVSRYHVSCITARLFVGIGRGELLPSKDTRQLLLQTWLEPLINDYSWLQHGCRSFDRKVVEEGIGRTILTLPLEEQQSILLSWLGSFLKAGDNCPNLQRAFEVWWRRTFIRPYMEAQGTLLQSDSSMASPVVELKKYPHE